MIEDLRAGAALASRLLGYPLEDALRSSRALPEIDAYYYWVPVRGGGQLLVGRDGSVLFGISSLTLAQMTTAFAEGRRTDPSLFEAD